MIKNIACPNPSRHGCGCPAYSNRCYGALRAVRERLAELRSNLPENEAVALCLAECEPAWGWSERELLSRFPRPA